MSHAKLTTIAPEPWDAEAAGPELDERPETSGPSQHDGPGRSPALPGGPDLLEVPSRVLLVEPSASERWWLRNELIAGQVEVFEATDVISAVRAVPIYQPNLILSQLRLPTYSGLELVRRLKEDQRTQSIPVLLYADLATAEERIRAFDLGAGDFVSKPFVGAELLARVRAALRTRHLLTMLEQRARLDGLTGLANRGVLEDRLPREWEACRRRGVPLAVLISDLDHFKAINDPHGHAAGDEVLRQAAATLARSVRTSDLVARYGGEEFVVVAPDCNLGCGAADWPSDSGPRSLELDIVEHGATIPVTTSVGVAVCPDARRHHPRGAAPAGRRGPLPGQGIGPQRDLVLGPGPPRARPPSTRSDLAHETGQVNRRSRGWRHAARADAVVGEAQRRHPRGVVQVAAVEDDRLAQQAGHDLEVGVAELVPLGDDRPGRRPARGRRRAGRSRSACRRRSPGRWRAPRGRGRADAAPAASSASIRTRAGASRMSSVRGLKARPQIGDRSCPARSPPKCVSILLEEDVLLGLVDLVDGLHHPRGQAARLGHVDRRRGCPWGSNCRRSRRRGRGTGSRSAGRGRCRGGRR